MFECDFDQSICNFQNDDEAKLEWNNGKGPTRTDDTGPASDHTTGNPNGGELRLSAFDIHLKLVSNWKSVEA